MSVLNFPDLQEVQVLETGDTVVLGGFSIDTEIELQHVRALIYIQGTTAGSERLRIRVTSDAEGTRTIHTSDWSNVSDISNLGANWYGWIRFDFNRQGMAKNKTRYLVLEGDNYTRNGDIFYISAIRDYPFPIYSSAANSFESAAFSVNIFGYEDVT